MCDNNKITLRLFRAYIYIFITNNLNKHKQKQIQCMQILLSHVWCLLILLSCHVIQVLMPYVLYWGHWTIGFTNESKRNAKCYLEERTSLSDWSLFMVGNWENVSAVCFKKGWVSFFLCLPVFVLYVFVLKKLG